MRAAFRPDAAAGVTASYSYELRVGAQVFDVRVTDGHCTTSEGRPGAPDVVMTLDVGTLGALLQGKLSPQQALASGRVGVEGDAAALQGFVSMFALREREPVTTG